MDFTLSRNRLQVRPVWLLIGAVVAYAVALLLTFPRWTVDDAFISFRYAQNLAQHGQLTWVVGADPVEGYTGFLWVQLLAWAIQIGLSPVVASQGMGVLALLACWWFQQQLLIELKASGRAQLAAFVLFGTSGWLWRHAFGGLETLLFTALVLWALLAHLQQREGFLLFLLLLCALTRPEGALLAAVLAGWGFWDRRRSGDFVGYMSAVWTALIFGALYFRWRYDYYGFLLPNTFYVKSGGVWDKGASLISLAEFLLIYLLAPALAGLTTGSLCDAGKGRARFFAPLGLFVLPLVVFYLRSSLIMNYAYRFWVPFYPLALIALALLFDTSRRWRRVWAAVGVTALLQATVWTYGAWQDSAVYQRLLSDEHERAAAYVNTHLPPGETVIAYVDAGLLGYETGRPVVDFGGLNDEYLAQLWAHQGPPSAAVEYFYAQRAGAVLWTPEAASWPGPYGRSLAPLIVEDPRWQDYQLVAEYDSPAWRKYYDVTYRQQLYIRRDLVKE